MPEILRYAAFTRDPAGGNPAGVVLDEDLGEATMQAIAAEVGYSETAFLRRAPEAPGAVKAGGVTVFDVRYFSPLAEVPFCGHATIASAVAIAEREGPGEILLRTKAGDVPVVTMNLDGALAATLTSVEAHVEDLAGDALTRALAALSWSASDLEPRLPPRVAFAGARHPVIAVRTRERLARLDYEFDSLAMLMREQDWTTLQLVWQESDTVYHVRDPFPVGGVVEDPATGAAAAAFGAYLRELGIVVPPIRVVLHQGADLGRPSLLLVDLAPGERRVRVTGHATAMA